MVVQGLRMYLTNASNTGSIPGPGRIHMLRGKEAHVTNHSHGDPTSLPPHERLTDLAVVHKCIMNSYNSIAKKKKNPTFKNEQMDQIDFFTKRDSQMANKYMKRYSTSLIVRKTQIETMMITPIRWLLLKRQQMTSVGSEVDK